MQTYVDAIRKNRKTRRRFFAVAVVAAFLVAFGVTWSLKSVGVALADPQCGLQEHTHSAACLGAGATCALAEHAHTDACYPVVAARAVGDAQEAGAAKQAEAGAEGAASVGGAEAAALPADVQAQASSAETLGGGGGRTPSLW